MTGNRFTKMMKPAEGVISRIEECEKCALYGLTDDEIKVVEKAVKK